MCDFISWIEKDNKTVFLTADDIFKTKAGRKLQKYCGNDRDLVGHGAIRHYYNFTGGIEHECTDFSIPNNFPPKIVKAIKAGKFEGLGTPEGLLLKKVYQKYEKIEQSAWAEYEKIQQSALAEYEKIEQSAYAKYEKIEQSAYAKYKKIQQSAWAEYEKIEQSALAEYEKIQQSAYAKYEKIEQSAFWKLFKNKKNRYKRWR